MAKFGYFFLLRAVRYDLFVEVRYNNSTTSGTYKNYLHFVEISLHTQNNNNLLIPDLFVRPYLRIFVKNYLPWNYDTTSWEAWVDSQFWIFLWTLQRLIKLLTTSEHNCCPSRPCFWSPKKPVSDRIKVFHFTEPEKLWVFLRLKPNALLSIKVTIAVTTVVFGKGKRNILTKFDLN